MRSLSPGTTRANLARTSSVDESLLSSVFPFPVLRGRPRPRREQSGPRFLVASARSDLKNQICVITLGNVTFQGRLLYRFDGFHRTNNFSEKGTRTRKFFRKVYWKFVVLTLKLGDFFLK